MRRLSPTALVFASRDAVLRELFMVSWANPAKPGACVPWRRADLGGSVVSNAVSSISYARVFAFRAVVLTSGLNYAGLWMSQVVALQAPAPAARPRHLGARLFALVLDLNQMRRASQFT